MYWQLDATCVFSVFITKPWSTDFMNITANWENGFIESRRWRRTLVCYM